MIDLLVLLFIFISELSRHYTRKDIQSQTQAAYWLANQYSFIRRFDVKLFNIACFICGSRHIPESENNDLP